MIYLDNAATTYPKPDSVYQVMDDANRNLAVNSGRGSYKVAREATELISDVRSKLLELVHGVNGEKAVITTSATNSLQIILHGIRFEKGDVVYVSPYEHNAVARNLEVLRKYKGIEIEEIPLVEESLDIDLDKFKYMMTRKPAKCVCCTHVSNVTGYILPVKEIFEMSHGCGAVNILDASQSFGLLEIDAKSSNADFIVFAGHKTLYGPFGASGFIDVNGIELESVLAGGTGSNSTNLDMPQESPNRYEAGSTNIIALAGLNEALRVLDQAGNYSHEKELTNYLVDKLRDIDGVTLYLPDDVEKHIGVVSFNVEGYTSEEVGMILDEDYDIAVRTGYHCAPYIHKYIKDKDTLGTVRIGLGLFNTKYEIDVLVEAVREI
ncbi:aminotransferase class V-fold PLP-dependent enzyme [Eubacterium xylanophilum]|uniref:aminotransferase class V-fold PLP-dependent enzyme n=1 Tax=Eubacterium xylanophilum TaxID=39497 RepID=UPI000479920C|nr:aminotransferase class V-fold PLP-dependent enzyme [Eubacterium xylanophilum]